MATESKDVELRVRARDYSAKTMKDVVKALHDLESAQEDQLKAAKKGEVSAAALEGSYKKMEQAVQALVKQHALTKTFQDQAAALELAKQKLDAARKAQSDYAASLDGVANRTDKQIEKTEKLARAVVGAENAQNNAQKRLDRTTVSLDRYGIAVDKVADSQQQIVNSVNLGNAALARQEAAIDSVAGDIARKAAADAAAAQTAKQAAADQAAADAAAAAAAKKAADIDEKRMRNAQQRADAIFEQARADKAATDAMRISAQQAEAAAKGYASLARSVKSVRGDALTNQLRDIVDPSAAANRNIESLGKTIDSLKGRVDAIRGPVQEFRQTLAQLEGAQAAAVGIAKSIDAYRRQVDALRAARTEYVNARTAVTALTQQMRAGGGDAAELGKQLATATNNLRTTAQTMSQQVSKTRELRTALREAGVDTANLGAAEAKLVTQAKTATAAIGGLTDAYEKNGAAAKNAGKSVLNFFGGEGRTTLSYAQRLRGELLGLATAFVGVQGVLGLAQGSLATFNTEQKITQTLLALTGGDAKAAREEYEYLLATANRLGLQFDKTAVDYSRLAIAAKAAGLSQQETRFIFEQFAQTARVAGLNGEEFEGVLRAITQMLSKGKIQAEELTGQLGDRLAGAFTIAAKSAGLTTGEFTKMMEQGAISSQYVINIARELGNTYKLTSEATNSLAANQARFENAAYQFKKTLAEQGFADAYTDFLKKLSELLASDDGAKLAQALSSGFSAIIDLLKLLAENIDTVKMAFSALIGLGVAKWVASGTTALISFVGILRGLVVAVQGGVAGMTALAAGTATVTAGATAATAATTGWRLALMLLTRTVPVLAAVTAAVVAATWAYDKLTQAKKDANDVPGAVDEDGYITRSKKKTPPPVAQPTADPGTGGTASQRATDAQLKELEKNQEKLTKAQKAAAEQGAKDSLAARKKLIDDEYQVRRDAATKEITDEKSKAKVLAEIDKQHRQALLIDQTEFNNQHQRKDESAASKRVRLQEQVRNDLLRIQADIAKDSTKVDTSSSFDDRLKTRLDSIAHSYDRLKKTIAQLAQLDKAGAAEATKRLDVLIKQTQEVEAFKATQEEIKRLEKELTDQAALGAAKQAEQKAQYDAGLISQEKFLANTAEITQRTDSAVTQAADNLQNFVDAAVKAREGILSLTEQAQVRTRTTTARADAGNTDNKIFEEQAKAQADAIESLVAKRSAAEALFKAQFDARLITEDQYAAKMNENAETYKKSLMEQITLLIQLLELQRGRAIVEGTMNQADLAALDAKILKYQQLGVAIGEAAKTQDMLSRTTSEFLNSGLDTALNGAVDALTDMAAGTTSVKEGFENLGRTVLQFFADFLRQIALAIIKQMILNALASYGGVWGQAASAIGGVASRNHSGGVIGTPNGSRREVQAQWFIGAPRFHEGGIPGLRSDEVPAILQTNEEVLSRDDPRNVLNGGAGGSQGPQRIVLVDDRSKIPEAMASAEGEQVTIQNITRNVPTIKAALGIK